MHMRVYSEYRVVDIDMPCVYTLAFLTLFIGMVLFTSSSALLRSE